MNKTEGTAFFNDNHSLSSRADKIESATIRRAAQFFLASRLCNIETVPSEQEPVCFFCDEFAGLECPSLCYVSWVGKFLTRTVLNSLFSSTSVMKTVRGRVAGMPDARADRACKTCQKCVFSATHNTRNVRFAFIDIWIFDPGI